MIAAHGAAADLRLLPDCGGVIEEIAMTVPLRLLETQAATKGVVGTPR